MVKLGVCLLRRKDTVMPTTLPDATVGLLGLEDIQDGGRGGITIRQTKPQEIESLKTRFIAGDILYGKLRPYLNKVGIASQAGLCSAEIWAFTPSPLVDSRFATFFLASSFFVDRVASLTKGANLPRLDTEAFDSIEIPLPPLSEQQRIVAILQEAEEIRRLRAEAEAKTAELIPAMFEGVFGDPVQNLRKWNIEPLASLINETPKNGLYKPAELYGEGTPIIRIGDFTGGILRTTRNLQRVRISDEEAEQFGVCNGQILINRVNSIEHLGKSLLVASLTEPTVYESNMMRLDPRKEKVVPDFLIACLQHSSIIAKLRAKAKKAINQASINQTDVLTLQMPVPPLTTQENFALQVAHAEELRASLEDCMRTERELSTALSAHAFSGQLTADWREAHQNQLASEARERDAALKEAGATFTWPRRTTIEEEIEELLQDRTDGIYSDLNREQRGLLREIERMVGGVDYARYFSAQLLSDYLSEGPLRRNPHAIEGHLAVFAARGLIISLSREEQTEDTGEFVFGNAYRLPLHDHDPREGEEGVPRIGDHARLRELERLAAQLEKERGLT
jgi:type I restriction enzyme S subunit